MKILATLMLIGISFSSFAKVYHCLTEGNAPIEVEMKFEKKLFRSIKAAAVSYKNVNGKLISETINCSEKEDVTTCKAPKTSALDSVVFHPTFGALYTLKGDKIAHFFRCE